MKKDRQDYYNCYKLRLRAINKLTRFFFIFNLLPSRMFHRLRRMRRGMQCVQYWWRRWTQARLQKEKWLYWGCHRTTNTQRSPCRLCARNTTRSWISPSLPNLLTYHVHLSILAEKLTWLSDSRKISFHLVEDLLLPMVTEFVSFKIF